MTCPECSAELDQSGACRNCGYRSPEDSPVEVSAPPERASTAGHSGPIQMDYSAAEPQPGTDRDSVPEWKKELSRRLQEIRQKRQESGTRGVSNGAPVGQTEPGPEKAEAADRPQPPQESRTVRPPRRSVPRVPRPAVPAAQVTTPTEELPLFQSPAQAGAHAENPDIGSVIDRVIEKHLTGSSAPSGAVARVEGTSEAAEARPRIVVSYGAESEEEERREERMTLLSRTLSGLVDLIVIIGCTVAIVVCTDVVAGITVLDAWSAVVYGALLLAVYFLYSVYFLGTGTQTLGMMITGLRLVGEDWGRPALKQVLRRTAAYLVALAPLGLGLLWGCFDPRARCWQDRLSGTRVARL